MPTHNIKRLAILAAVLYGICCGIALGQSTSYASPAQKDSALTKATATELAANASALMQRSGGSLLKANLAAQADSGRAKLSDISFFAVPEPEPRTYKAHDLVTIIVREESEFSSSASTDIKKEGNIEAKIEEWVKLKVKNLQLTGGGIGGTAPSLKASGTGEFKGDGTLDRSDSLTFRITAEVVDVKPNGMLVLQARKTITTDDEVQQFILTGTCRAEDVGPDNTVLSTQVSDQDVRKMHKGSIRDATKKGWVGKLLDVINPF